MGGHYISNLFNELYIVINKSIPKTETTSKRKRFLVHVHSISHCRYNLIHLLIK